MKKTETIKAIFENYDAIELFNNAEEDDFEMRDDDLYFFDPQNELGITLGAMGDGWVCIYEEFNVQS